MMRDLRVERLAALASVGLLFFLVLWAAASLIFPFGWDQGMFAGVADVMLRGGQPYRDAWDMKGPLAYCAVWLSAALFGRNMWGIRVLDLLAMLAAAAFMKVLLGRIASRVVGVWAALAFALSYAAFSWFSVSEPDFWATALVIGAAMLGAHAPAAPSRLFGAGTLIGAAFLLKPFFGLFGLVPILAACAAQNSLRPFVRAAVPTAFGAAIPVVLAAVWLSTNGALEALTDIWFRFAFDSYTSAGAGKSTSAIAVLRFVTTGESRAITPRIFLWAAYPLIAIGLSRISILTPAWKWFLLAWTLLAFLCVLAQAQFFTYHWLPVLPPLLALAAAGAGAVFRHVPVGSPRSTPLRAVAALSACSFLALTAVSPARDVWRAVRVVARVDRLADYYGNHSRFGYDAGDVAEAVEVVRKNSSAGDTIAFYGNLSGIAFLADRRNASRFIFSLPLIRGGAVSDRYRDEYLAGLERDPPRQICVGPSYEPDPFGDFPRLRAFVAERYELLAKIGGIRIYQRKD